MLNLILVEDSPGDVELFRIMMKELHVDYSLKVFYQGEEFMYYAERSPEIPTAVILDLNLPRVSGFEVLEWIKNHPVYKSVKVAILTSSENKTDEQRAKEKGAFFCSKGWYYYKGLDCIKDLIQVLSI